LAVLAAVKPVLLALAVLAASAAPAAAAPLAESPDLWATINVCDTVADPREVGMRASMPRPAGSGTPFMRFRVQYQADDGRWRFVPGPSADSGLRRARLVRGRRHEAGWTFSFAKGRPVLVRGHVTFLWRKGGRTTRRLVELTEAGHRSSAGSRPRGYSAAYCEIS
jgi:hypothetical protein